MEAVTFCIGLASLVLASIGGSYFRDNQWIAGSLWALAAIGIMILFGFMSQDIGAHME